MRSASFFDLLPQYPPMISMIWSACLYAIIFGFLYLFYKRIKSMNNRRTLIFWKDGTQSLRSFPIEDGKLTIRKAGLGKSKDKDWCPIVKSENVFPAKQSFRNQLPFGFKQRDLFIGVEDSPELVSLKGAIEAGTIKDGSILLKTWTKKEINQFIKKALAQGAVQRKIFSDTQFYMFFAILFLNLVMTFLIVQAMGII